MWMLGIVVSSGGIQIVPLRAGFLILAGNRFTLLSSYGSESCSELVGKLGSVPKSTRGFSGLGTGATCSVIEPRLDGTIPARTFPLNAGFPSKDGFVFGTLW